jgi:hypothetical protein
MKIKMFMSMASAILALLTAVAHGLPPAEEAEKPPAQTEQQVREPLPDRVEARGRAKLLHETIHATLQIVHHRYFREDEGIPVPAFTLKSVFAELATEQKVKLRWLVVNAQAMSVDHEPQDEFERQAAKALADGQPDFELVDQGVYRHVAAITLKSECLKCHLPNRKSTEPRLAGLVISMPIEED